MPTDIPAGPPADMRGAESSPRAAAAGSARPRRAWQTAGPARHVARLLLLSIVYVLCVAYAERFIKGAEDVTLFWPAAGIAFAAVLHYGPRYVVFIPGAVLVTHLLLIPVPLAFLPFSLASNVLGSLAASWVIRRLHVHPQVAMRSGVGMLTAGVLMALVAATVGVAGLGLSGMVPPLQLGRSFAIWTLGDLLGITCVAPSVLLLLARVRVADWMAAQMARPAERGAWLGLFALSGLFVYWAGSAGSGYALGTIALPLALLIWSALRFAPTWTAISTCAAILFMTSLTGLGLAGFERPEGLLDTVLLVSFMLLFAVVPLMLAGLANEQRMSARRVLRDAVANVEAQRLELERQVDERTAELHAANLRLQEASHTDPLTGLHNRRYLAAQLPPDLAYYEREQRSPPKDDACLVFALVDIDHFKRINDTHGHAAGDRVLQQFAEAMTRHVRTGDYVVRWGGEEFLLVFRPVPRLALSELGERMRLSVANRDFAIGDGQVIPVTCSIGLAEYCPTPRPDSDLGWEQAVELADGALYSVKRNGRDGWAVVAPSGRVSMATLRAGLSLGTKRLLQDGALVVSAASYLPAAATADAVAGGAVEG